MTIVFFIAIAFLFGLAQVFRYARWEHLLTAIPGWEFNRTFRGFILGQFFNIFVPFKIGDLIRASTSASKLDSVFLIILTLISERILDATYLFFIFYFILGYDGNIINAFGLTSIAAFSFVNILNFYFQTFTSSVSKKFKFMNYLLVTTLIVSACFRKGLQLRTTFLTISMWLCNSVATFLMAKHISGNQDPKEIVNVLYLNLTAPYLKLNPLSIFCLIMSILFALILIYALRLTRRLNLIQMKSVGDNWTTNPLSLGELAIVLSRVDKNEKIIGTFSGGSGATTILMKNIPEKELFVRKYVKSEESKSLESQFKVLAKFNSKNVISPTNIRKSQNSFSFDMPYLENYVTFTDFLLFQGSSQIKPAAELILKTHLNVFEQPVHQSKLRTNWDAYLRERVNPEIRLLPIIESYLSLYPEKSDYVLFLYSNILDFYTTHLENLEIRSLKDDLLTCHGDFSTSNIMIGQDMRIVFIDLVDQKEHSSIINDYAKLHFSLHSGFDATIRLLNTSPKFSSSVGDLPSLVTTNGIQAIEALENFLLQEGGMELVRNVQLLSPLHTFRVLPYRLEQDVSNTENWLKWALDHLYKIEDRSI